MAAARKITLLAKHGILSVKRCIKQQVRLSSHFPIDDNLYGLTDEQKQVK